MTSEGADQQVVIQKKNKKSSIKMSCSWNHDKWEVDKTEIIKLKKDNRYTISDGASHYERAYTKSK